MKKFVLLFLIAITCGCGSSPIASADNLASPEKCEFTFETIENTCHFKTQHHDIAVKILISPLFEDELALEGLKITANNQTQELSITPDTTLLAGDQGYISFADINFDSIPDLAITTSFGVANLYLDYWVFNAKEHTYIPVGNLSQLTTDAQENVLRSEVRVNAATYEQKTWKWRGYQLIRVESE